MRPDKVIDISVVIPYYKASESLRELYQRLLHALDKISPRFEIILVNDASPDNGWEIIKELSRQDQRVKGINFSRNFGQHYGITAGLDHASGQWVVVMDCDLQDQPEEILKLYTKAQEGFDVVFGRRYERKDSFFKRACSTLFFTVYDYLTDSKVDNSVANFSISRKIVIENFRRIRESNRTFPLFIRWMGFAIGYVDVEHAARPQGKTSYDLRKLLKLSADSIVSQTNKPLRLSIKLGFLISFLSFIYACYLVCRYLLFFIPVEGWTSVMVSVWFIAGLTFANMGIVGMYLGKVFDETKGRPLYIVKELVGIEGTADTQR